MRKLGIVGVVALLLLSASGQAYALVVNPLTGASGFGGWGAGLGSLIDFGGGDTALSITVGTSTLFDVSADDCCVVGDMFGLRVDSVPVAWTLFSGGSAGILFHGEYIGLFLSPGVHSLQLEVTQDCCSSGSMSWAVSAGSPVPEPTTLALLGAGLAGWTGLRRRRRT